MAVLGVARNGAPTRPWLQALLARPPFKVAAVAQASKTARIIWALLNKAGLPRTGDYRGRHLMNVATAKTIKRSDRCRLAEGKMQKQAMNPWDEGTCC